MTVQELIDVLKRANPSDTVLFRVDCPFGGNSLPVQFNPKRSDKSWINLFPVDGYEFEVTGTPDEEEDIDLDEPFSPEPQWGQCGKCGDWVTFPCCNCIARDLDDLPDSPDYAEPPTDDTGGGRY